MDSYLMNSLFAANALEYLFKTLGWPWESQYTYFLEECQIPQFDENIGKAIYTIWEKNDEDFKACYMELRKEGVNDKETFSKYAVNAADSYFSKGYSPGSFLGYCAIVLGVATFYYEYPPNSIPETAVEIIAIILFSLQLKGEFHKQDGWRGLRETSRLFNIVSGTTCSKVSRK